MIIGTSSGPPNPDPKEAKRRARLISAAKAIMNQSDKFSAEVQARLQQAFDYEQFEEVTKIAAEADITQRRSLASKITVIPNPNFKPDTLESIRKEIVDKTLDKFTPSEIETFLQQIKDEERREVEKEMKPQEDREPPLLFKIEGVEGTFKSASSAAKAYRDKFGLPQPEPIKRIHGFKSMPLFPDDLELPGLIADFVSRYGSVPDQIPLPEVFQLLDNAPPLEGESECDDTPSAS